MTIVVIPAYNEERSIRKVLRHLKKAGFNDIIVVDDGSTDKTKEYARTHGAIVISHLINRGVGAASGTGLRAAVLCGARIVVTCDADGQHAAEDLKRVIQPIVMGRADAVIGTRMLDPTGMPWVRQVANRAANLLTAVLFHVHTTDSQSGLRAFSRYAAQRIRISTNGYDVSSEIIAEIGRHRLRLEEVTIKPIYTGYSLSKGQGLRMGLETFFRLVLTKHVR